MIIIERLSLNRPNNFTNALRNKLWEVELNVRIQKKTNFKYKWLWKVPK